MIQPATLIVPRTARYYTWGHLGPQTTCVWLVLHGYGQLAKFFIRKFEKLATGHQVVIAPEGLSKYYLQGTAGRVGASWMTKEDRLDEIKDFSAYLDLLYKEIRQQVPPDTGIKVLGFSQGATTACRWLLQSQASISQLVLWAGTFPEDVSFAAARQRFGTIPLTCVYGTQDPFLTPEKMAQQAALFAGLSLQPKVLRFTGGHEIDKAALTQIAQF